MRARPFLVLFHRYVGLVMAGFLVIAGLTGAALVWYEELDTALNPHLFYASPPAPDAPMLDMLTLREMAVRQTGESVRYFSLKLPAPGHAAIFLPADQEPANQIFVDPYTGRVVGRRLWGDIGQGVGNLMPFLYRLHYSLLMDRTGQTIFGIVAFLWTLDSFVGAWLTLPMIRGRGWLSRWGKAWRLRMKGGAYKLNFDLHRAGGLWLWAMLLVLAWSSVAFNLRQVYDPVMKTLFAHQAELARQALPRPNDRPGLDWYAAHETARKLMAQEAEKHDFTIHGEDWFVHDPERNLYFYDVRSSLDISERNGRTRLFFDADSGKMLRVELPTGAASGDTIYTWISSMHRAELWGLPFKLFMTVTGLVVAMLSVTGVLIWRKKRRARFAHARKHPRSPATFRDVEHVVR